MKNLDVSLLLLGLLLSGCKENRLELYEGRWQRVESDSLERILQSGEQQHIEKRMYDLIGTKTRPGSYWHIKDGGIFSIDEDSGSETRIDIAVLEDNLNYGEILVYQEDFGYWVIHLELREEQLRISYNPFSHEYTTLEPYDG